MDRKIERLIIKENERQNKGIELIASENFTSKQVRNFCGSILTNKYAEGYPNKRYYGGCKYIDEIEQIAINRACKLFNCKFANVQPHSGSQANAACYKALLPEGGKILSLVLNDGGHLTHGSPVSFSSHQYNFVFYPLGKNGKLDYETIKNVALKEKPNILLAGYSSYPYLIDFKTLKEIANMIGAYLMVDMAHIAGLVAAKAHPSPFPFADIVSSTTHKTLRGPRGGLILTNSEEIIKKVNSAIFPYYQGGPLEHIIAGKAACFLEASSKKFQNYASKIVNNTKVASSTFKQLNDEASDSDNHLFLLNTLSSFSLNGLESQKKLEEINITTNKNMLPNDTLKPNKTSGLRIGFAAVTTRGCTEKDAKDIAILIHKYLKNEISKEKALIVVNRITKKWKKIDEI